MEAFFAISNIGKKITITRYVQKRVPLMIEFLVFASINFLGVMSPGPNFAVVTGYALPGLRRAAFLASLGIGVGLLFDVSYCLLAIAFSLKTYPFVFQIMQILGACYLGFFGYTMLKKRGEEAGERKKFFMHEKAFMRGFVTNFFNANGTLFIVSLFTQFVSPETPFHIQLAHAITTPIFALIWFFFLSYVLTHRVVYGRVRKYQTVLTKAMGVLLMVFAGYILFTSLQTIGDFHGKV